MFLEKVVFYHSPQIEGFTLGVTFIRAKSEIISATRRQPETKLTGFHRTKMVKSRPELNKGHITSPALY